MQEVQEGEGMTAVSQGRQQELFDLGRVRPAKQFLAQTCQHQAPEGNEVNHVLGQDSALGKLDELDEF